MAEAPLNVIPRRIVAINIDSAEDSPADKLLQLAQYNLSGKATPMLHKNTIPNPIIIREHKGYAQTCPSCVVDHSRPNYADILNPSKASPPKEFEMSILKALLQKQIPIDGSGNRTYPLTIVVKVSNELLTRDLVVQFLMGPNSVYLLIYNWKEELEVVNENGVSESFNNELLKWMHTIGFSSTVDGNPDQQTTSTMLVTTHFDELVSKYGENRSEAKRLAIRQASQVCRVLKSHNNHTCANTIDPKPILMGCTEEFEENSAPRLAKMATDNFTAFKMSPQEIMLLNQLRAPENLPVMSVRVFLQIASDLDISRKEALRVLKLLTNMRLIFSLPRHTESTLKNLIFTDLNWLVNTLFEFLTAPELAERGSLWSKWENLLDTGIMSQSLKNHISKTASNTHQLLPTDWIFELLEQLNLFTPNVCTPRNNVSHFCPLYLPECRSEKSHSGHHQSDGDIPPLYLRPNTGCITDQYTMRLFCWITHSQLLSLQECCSRTQAIFLSRENHLRFTLSRSMDCLKVTIESSFTGRTPDQSASDVAYYLISRIVMASKEMGDTWFPVPLTRATGVVEDCRQLPNLCFQCHCDQVDYPHLAEMVYQPADSLLMPFLQCEVCQQASDITDGEKFWTSHVSDACSNNKFTKKYSFM